MTKATHYLGAMEAGYCLPQLFRCDDGNRYVVKFMSNPQGIRGLANELIACRLGSLLDLPVVPGRVVEVTQRLIDAEPELQKAGVQAGPHFGSLYVSRVQAPTEKAIAKCVNLDKVAGMIVFDHWVQNDDRDTGNVLITRGDQLSFYMIDHESCFCGSGWYDEDLFQHRGRVEPYWAEVYPRFLPFVDWREQPFSAALERLEELTYKQIASALRGVPSEWGVEADEWELLADYLERRKLLVRGAIGQLKRYLTPESERKNRSR
ncbi:MAG: HipA family kinase [Tumebacillaceae bacterium]